jgi:nitrite reductase/ring-hydroxylating ferredoxin subunit
MLKAAEQDLAPCMIPASPAGHAYGEGYGMGLTEQRNAEPQAFTVAKEFDIPVGEMRGFTLAGRKVLIANVGGQYHAMDAVCSHAGGYLPAGRLEGKMVRCPVHGAEFDVTTGCMVIYVPGKVSRNVNAGCRDGAGHGPMDLRTYKVVVERNEIRVMV